MTAPPPGSGGLFTREQTPSVKFTHPGTKVVINVSDWPSLHDSKDFTTGAIDRWQDGTAKKIILVPGNVNGEKHALWVTPGTALFAAIEQAQKDAGAEVAPGGTLSVEFTHTVPSSKGAHFHPAKQYTASYTPPSAFGAASATASADPWTPAPPGVPAVAAPPSGAQQYTAEQLAALTAAGIDTSQFAQAG